MHSQDYWALRFVVSLIGMLWDCEVCDRLLRLCEFLRVILAVALLVVLLQRGFAVVVPRCS